MKIGLLGYGKMGRAIETIARDRGHEIVFGINRSNYGTLTQELLKKADVVIEFTRPEAAYDNVMLCLDAGVPVVCGTTGWLEEMQKVRNYCLIRQGAMLWASNFSIGVNLLFAANRRLAALMNGRPEYEPSVTEIHHVHKLDAPSGTGITLTQDILMAVDRKKGWSLHPAPPQADEIPVTSVREGEVPGTHIIRWISAVDEIRLEHIAHSRTGFAEGALLAAVWLAGKKGVFNMNDVLGID